MVLLPNTMLMAPFMKVSGKKENTMAKDLSHLRQALQITTAVAGCTEERKKRKKIAD